MDSCNWWEMVTQITQPHAMRGFICHYYTLKCTKQTGSWFSSLSRGVMCIDQRMHITFCAGKLQLPDAFQDQHHVEHIGTFHLGNDYGMSYPTEEWVQLAHNLKLSKGLLAMWLPRGHKTEVVSPRAPSSCTQSLFWDSANLSNIKDDNFLNFLTRLTKVYKQYMAKEI